MDTKKLKKSYYLVYNGSNYEQNAQGKECILLEYVRIPKKFFKRGINFLLKPYDKKPTTLFKGDSHYLHIVCIEEANDTTIRQTILQSIVEQLKNAYDEPHIYDVNNGDTVGTEFNNIVTFAECCELFALNNNFKVKNLIKL